MAEATRTNMERRGIYREVHAINTLAASSFVATLQHSIISVIPISRPPNYSAN